jgi:hypothetical protein
MFKGLVVWTWESGGIIANAIKADTVFAGGKLMFTSGVNCALILTFESSV